MKYASLRDLIPAGSLSGLTEATASLQRRLGAMPDAMPAALRDFLDRGARAPATAPSATPEGAQFLAASFSNQAGTRPYKLYIPSGYSPRQPVPLIVMLHGCTQSPDDFARGTGMNAAAEQEFCLVAYPGQTNAANAQKCWNWFNAADQRHDGEPSLISGITRAVMRSHAVDPARVYVAGLSAGGAAAAIMGAAYPDLYAAVGVHSGLACGAARDMRSAFAAMQRGAPGAPRSAPVPPTIVFHGDRDTTVHPRNGEAVLAQAVPDTLWTRVETGQVQGGHAYTRTVHIDANGQTVAENWTIHGAGHAWSGGSPAGSYTDPRGPDATSEMLRFFREHPRPV
jgi:poly(hydroxyalkanoate) depolymerase family esterase